MSSVEGDGVKAVFLDRDGTLIELVEYLSDPDKTELLPGSGEALRLIREEGLRIIVITNQSGLARGYFTEEILDAIHERMQRQLGEVGAHVDAIFYCPHHPDEGCGCRKPEPGLIEKAAEELAIDLEGSYMIGDRIDDVACGKVAGCKGVLVLTGYGSGELALRERWNVIPDHIADNLLGAAEWIVKDLGGE